MTTNQTNDQTINLEDLYDEYKIDDSIFSDESPKIKKIKRFIYEDLDEVSRRVIFLYAELGSLRKLGKVLGISASSAFIKVSEIKQRIKENIRMEDGDLETD